MRRGIALRVGVIDMGGAQRTEQARTELAALGVTEVGYDRLRQVGRGVRDQQASIEQLCGRCGDGVAAVSPDGAVWPCVFSRWLPVGNVLDRELADILASPKADAVRAELAAQFAQRSQPTGCRPGCNPTCAPSCNPHCQPTCSPRCSPTCHPISAGPATSAVV
ncbi:MAG: SPASM domain-containing protein [Mycobacterium sp.]|nr:SPASM domain-containing protein [Mycobacterium sp.]